MINQGVISKFCDKHKKKYESVAVKLLGKIICRPCPDCMADRRKRCAPASEKTGEQKFNEVILSQGRIEGRHAHCTFDSYAAISDGQKKALRATQKYANDILNKKAHGLILSGGRGTGKNHLACSIAISLIEKGSRAQIWTAEDMVAGIRCHYNPNSGKTSGQVISDLKNLDLLIIDEIRRYDEKECALLFGIINGRYERLKPTMVMSNLDIDGIKQVISAPGYDRLREGGGKHVSFDWGSYR